MTDEPDRPRWETARKWWTTWQGLVVLVVVAVVLVVGATVLTIAGAQPTPSGGPPPAPPQDELVIRAQGDVCYWVELDGVEYRIQLNGRGSQHLTLPGQYDTLTLTAC